MPSITDFVSEKVEEFEQIDELKNFTPKAMDQLFASFKKYLASQQQKRGLANRDWRSCWAARIAGRSLPRSILVTTQSQRK